MHVLHASHGFPVVDRTLHIRQRSVHCSPRPQLPIHSSLLLVHSQRCSSKRDKKKTATMETTMRGARMPAARPSALGKNKKLRKPYTITRPRERWTDEEHLRFLYALHIFGRDWKSIEALVATKTSVQIRSHAQKHFLKAQKLGLAACLPPPLHPRRAAANSHIDTDMLVPTMDDFPCAAAPEYQCPAPDLHAPGAGEWTSAAPMHPQHEAIELPLSPDDPRFALVYRFVGDVFASDAAVPVDAQLQCLHLPGVDPLVVDTILLVLRNLEANLCA